MKTSLTTAALGALLALPAAGAAQEIADNPFRLEPYAGALVDSYDASPDGEHTGIHAGLRLGYSVGERARVVASVGYSGSSHVSDPNGLEDYFVYRNNWILTTAGAEFDVVPGPTSASLGVQAGAGWRRIDLEGQVGSPPSWSDQSGHGFSPVALVAPEVAIRQRLTSRADLRLGFTDYIFFGGPVEHSPALTAGVSLR